MCECVCAYETNKMLSTLNQPNPQVSQHEEGVTRQKNIEGYYETMSQTQILGSCKRNLLKILFAFLPRGAKNNGKTLMSVLQK